MAAGSSAGAAGRTPDSGASAFVCVASWLWNQLALPVDATAIGIVDRPLLIVGRSSSSCLAHRILNDCFQSLFPDTTNGKCSLFPATTLTMQSSPPGQGRRTIHWPDDSLLKSCSASFFPSTATGKCSFFPATTLTMQSSPLGQGRRTIHWPDDSLMKSSRIHGRPIVHIGRHQSGHHRGWHYECARVAVGFSQRL